MKLRVAPHYCYDWDGLYVRPWDVEATACHETFTLRVWLRCWFWHLARGPSPGE